MYALSTGIKQNIAVANLFFIEGLTLLEISSYLKISEKDVINSIMKILEKM